jgi:hypothetical protein
MTSLKPTIARWMCGDTFFYKRPNTDDHLQVVLSDPSRNPDKIVIVNFSSVKPFEKELGCIIAPGEHPYVKIKTFIPYRFAYTVKIEFLEDNESRGHIAKQEPLSPELLNKALLGASQSLFMPTEIWDVIENQGLVDLF